MRHQLSISIISLGLIVAIKSQEKPVSVFVKPILTKTLNGPLFNVQLVGNTPGETLNLLLTKPTDSVFTSDFKFTVATTDPLSGKPLLKDDTPPQSSLRSLENHIFIDEESLAALNLDQDSSGLIQLDGVIEDFSIHHKNTSYSHTLKPINERLFGKTDFIDLNRNITFSHASTKAGIQASAETWVVLDYDHSEQFGFDRNKILTYLATFYRAINNRYATISSPPLISFRICGLTIIQSRGAQPFIENNRVPDGSGYEINGVLADFSKWAFQNVPNVDMAALLSNTDLQNKEGAQGSTYVKNVAGLAYIKAACWKDNSGSRLLATSVSEDMGAFYDGIYTVSHEYAHNLGSPHDGFGEAASCLWSDGYLMSYEGWGTKRKLYFSQCSINIMTKFIQSNEGKCLTVQEGPSELTNPNSAPDVGDTGVVDMLQSCVKYTKKPDAVVDPTKSPSDLCKNLVCKYGNPSGGVTTYTVNRPPGDNSLCGNGGRCQNGECLGDKGVRNDNMAQQCVKYSQQPSAQVAKTKTPSQQCKALTCTYTQVDKPGWVWTWTYSGPPDYGTICGDDKKGTCLNGECVPF